MSYSSDMKDSIKKALVLVAWELAMSNEMKGFIKDSLVSGSSIIIKLEYVEGTWFFDITNRNSNVTKYFFTADSRMAQLYLHDLERVISDVRYLWCDGEGHNNVERTES